MTQSPNPQLNDADLELLSAYIDSQLTSAARAACEERLRREPMLRAALDELRATIVLLHELEPLKPPRSFALDPQAYPPRRVPLFARLNLGSALTAVALAFIFLTIFVVRGLQPGGTGQLASAPAANPGGPQAFTLESTAQAESSNRSSAATTEAPAATAAPPEVAAAEAPTGEASADAQAAGEAAPTAASDSANSQAAGESAPAPGLAPPNAAASTAQPSLAQQPSDTPPQEPLPPIATSGSTSSGTSYLPPQPVTPGIAVQTPISIVIGVLLLLIVGLLWWTRRRRR